MKRDPQYGAPKLYRKWLFLLLASCVLISGLDSGSTSLSNRTAKVSRRAQISVISELVPVPVNVTDAKGNFVPGLTQNNFRIYENGHPQNITVFQQEDSPVGVGLLVDHSGSMGSKLPNVLTAISGFVQSSNAQDEMFAVNFGDDVTIGDLGGKAFTSDSTELQRAVSATAAQGRTALYDAVAAGLSHLQLARWQKKALVVVSDGGDNASRHKYSQILALARQSHVTIYSIGLVDESGEEENPATLEKLCKETGGIAFFPRSPAQVVDATAHIAKDLREQYMLGFEPEQAGNGGEFHKIQVRVVAAHRGKLHARTRLGYVTPDAKTSPVELDRDASQR